MDTRGRAVSALLSAQPSSTAFRLCSRHWPTCLCISWLKVDDPWHAIRHGKQRQKKPRSKKAQEKDPEVRSPEARLEPTHARNLDRHHSRKAPDGFSVSLRPACRRQVFRV